MFYICAKLQIKYAKKQKILNWNGRGKWTMLDAISKSIVASIQKAE